MTCGGLLRRRECLVPTWRGCLLLLVLCVGLILVATRTAYPFLAVNQPIAAQDLVIEGWATESAMEAAVAEFHQHSYRKVFVTGIPMEHGVPLSEYKTYAELGAATLLKLGLGTNVVQAVPAPAVRKDRTYASGASLARWLREHGMTTSSINLMTSAPHARRSRLLYQAALGKTVKVGIIAIPEESYDPRYWWRTSAGFRTVTGELMAYGYVRLFFHAPKD